MNWGAVKEKSGALRAGCKKLVPRGNKERSIRGKTSAVSDPREKERGKEGSNVEPL